MRSKIFYTHKYLDIASSTLEFLNEQEDFLSESTADSPRAVGDAIQEIISTEFKIIVGDDCKEYSDTFARRSMADLAFKDNDGCYYIVDVKTHREDTSFNMPNLTSVERLARFYEDDLNYFSLLIVQYVIKETRALISKVIFCPIEFLSWECLTIGALGWGQIQIANSNRINVNPFYSRRKWMLELCDVMLEFYPKEVDKIGKRVLYFERVKKIWQEKNE